MSADIPCQEAMGSHSPLQDRPTALRRDVKASRGRQGGYVYSAFGVYSFADATASIRYRARSIEAVPARSKRKIGIPCGSVRHRSSATGLAGGNTNGRAELKIPGIATETHDGGLTLLEDGVPVRCFRDQCGIPAQVTGWNVNGEAASLALSVCSTPWSPSTWVSRS